jgi:hypothetical protein
MLLDKRFMFWRRFTWGIEKAGKDVTNDKASGHN